MNKRGTTGNDVIRGTSEHDSLDGLEGNDILFGNEGGDVLSGGAGSDQLYGDDGADNLYGDSGNDYLSGGSGRDYLKGGDGNDTLVGGTGNDTMSGGSGADTFLFTENTESGSDIIYEFNVFEDRIQFDVDSNGGSVFSSMTFDDASFRFDVLLDFGNAGSVVLNDLSMLDATAAMACVQFV